ncbi:hypothetical protein ACFXJJ_27690, partial [Streptomyces sp. NPDC059233]
MALPALSLEARALLSLPYRGSAEADRAAEEGADRFEVVNVSFWIRDEDLRAGGRGAASCPPVLRSRLILTPPGPRPA